MKLKSFKIFTVILLIHCFFSCEEKEDTAKAIVEIEATAPIISVSEIAETIEVLTTIDISVSDNTENVNTTISINGNNVFTTTQNQFSYDIDPFEFPNGATNLVISAIDEDGNETVKSFQFISNRLLFQGDEGYSSDTVDSYLAINLESSGELIAFRKLIGYEDLAFYANDEFEKQNLIITNYLVNVDDGSVSARSYSDVKPATILKNRDEVLNLLGLDQNWVNKNSEFNIEIQEAISYSLFYTLGFEYSFGQSNNNNFNIRYDNESANDVFLYHHTNDNLNLLDDYRYLYTESFEDQTMNFGDLTKLIPENVATITFSEDVKNFNFTLFGFSDDYAYKEFRMRLLYSFSGSTEENGFVLDYPIINEYQYNQKSLSYSLYGKSVHLERKELNDLDIPNWNVIKNESTVEITGDYDFSELTYIVDYSSTDNRTALIFRYQSLFKESIIIPFDKLEIPLEIVNSLNGIGVNLESTSSNSKLSITLTQFENIMDYPNGVFYQPIANEVGDVTKVTFPLNN
ncbi:hypothetical protein [Maribacter dokdonensis]|uniref:hypothetical protein n=1 Tax=Maribacter dokdonensis TaxID=320912 RepID=UPI001C07FEEF|nr:hypothetical protein [Maribacter dokdonensis]MBU2900295.1 hypothetical protein [Maribacter dokdonensis]